MCTPTCGSRQFLGGTRGEGVPPPGGRAPLPGSAQHLDPGGFNSTPLSPLYRRPSRICGYFDAPP